jgi:site-specific DNA-methyltransferase (adenine-specific)
MNSSKCRIINADSIYYLPQLEPNSFDALITDPPYSSGGLSMADRQKSPLEKYSQTNAKRVFEYLKHEFKGDNMDQRAWTNWAAHWLGLCRNVVKPGGVAAVFIDWRQLASLYDAIQWAGWLLRGVLPWDKINARPQPARPRQQCEFIVWASNGPLSTTRPAPYLPGLFQYTAPAPQKRTHQTEKSLDMMRQLVHICVDGGRILDPFAGSGTTICAAALEGFEALGIELDEYHAQKAQERLQKLNNQTFT